MGVGVGRDQRPGGCRSRAKSRDAHGTSLSACRRGPRLGNRSQFRGPRGHTPCPHFSHSRPQTPTLLGAGGAPAQLPPPILTFSNKLPSPSSQSRGRPRRPGSGSTPAGRARHTLTSPCGARCQGSRARGSEAPLGVPPAAAAPGARAAHGRRGAPAEKPARGSPVRPAAPARAPAPAAAGAALSPRRALQPSTGDLRRRGPTPASRFARPRGTPATFTCGDLALPSSARI